MREEKNNSTMRIKIILIFVSLILALSGFRFLKGFFLLPIGIRHFMNLVLGPKDIYEPIVVDSFLFYKKGYSKTYLLHPKYLDVYEIGFFNNERQIPSGYEYKGKIKAEFFYNNKLLLEKTATSMQTMRYFDNDMEYYKEISLLNFNIPLMGHKNDIHLKLTVLEPDEELKKFKDSVKLFIAVSATP